jgi:hypothetical protein
MSSGRSWMLGIQDQARREDDTMKKLRARHLQIMKAKRRFAEIFGADVKQFYKDIHIGFDVIAFDDYLMTKDEAYRKANLDDSDEEVECSMDAHIKAKYGEEAALMIRLFVGMEG